MELYVVIDEESLYVDRVGSCIWQDRTRINLDIGDDKILLDMNQVERVI